MSRGRVQGGRVHSSKFDDFDDAVAVVELDSHEWIQTVARSLLDAPAYSRDILALCEEVCYTVRREDEDEYRFELTIHKKQYLLAVEELEATLNAVASI
jgi:hypothetical protein